MFGTIASIAAPIIGGMITGDATKKAAEMDAASQRRAQDINAQGYNDARPYITDLYSRGQGALDAALAAGSYQGPTYAGMDPVAREGYEFLSGFGRNAMGQGQGMMNTGGNFGTNYQNIFNRASGPTMENAMGFAMNNPMMDGMVNSAMRDSRRQLEEQTLPGISMGASGSGNTNASRAGMADGIAQRGYADREADVRSNMMSDMVRQYRAQNNTDINNMLSANSGLMNTFNTGFRMGPTVAQMLTTPGAAYQTDAQAQLDADRSAFERNRNFEMDALNQYASGILGQAPRTTTVSPITANPYTAQLGGMMAGAGFGNKSFNFLQNLFPNALSTS